MRKSGAVVVDGHGVGGIGLQLDRVGAGGLRRLHDGERAIEACRRDWPTVPRRRKAGRPAPIVRPPILIAATAAPAICRSSCVDLPHDHEASAAAGPRRAAPRGERLDRLEERGCGNGRISSA